MLPATSHASQAPRPQDSTHASRRAVGTTLVYHRGPPPAQHSPPTGGRRRARRDVASLRPSAPQPEDHGSPGGSGRSSCPQHVTASSGGGSPFLPEPLTLGALNRSQDAAATV